VVPVARNFRAPRSARELGRQYTHDPSRLYYLEPPPGYRWPWTLGGKQMQSTAPAPGTEHGPVALPRTRRLKCILQSAERASCRPESLLVPPLPAATSCVKRGHGRLAIAFNHPRISHAMRLGTLARPAATGGQPARLAGAQTPRHSPAQKLATSAPTIARPGPCQRPPPLRCAWPARAWPEW
jgi:hypothetical protein